MCAPSSTGGFPQRDSDAKATDEQAGREKQAAIRALLATLPDRLFLDRTAFEAELDQAAKAADLKLTAPTATT